MLATVRCVMKHVIRTAGLVAIVALFASSCGGAGTETPTTTSSVESPTTSTVVSSRTIFLIENGPTEFTLQKVVVTDEAVASDLTDQVRRALAALIRFTGTTLEDYNRGQLADLGTFVPQGISINSVEIVGGVVTIDLNDAIRLTSGSSSQEMLFAQQLAHTSLLDASLTELRVLINGQPFSELWGHVDWSMLMTADLTLLE
ncbi:unannotated protein [freshwater metagenome]|uniref:Unannotated protein n=1 Tax=freshwater metagenome TaxID=449393 RepID=A0A6J6LVK9_9ZZZZ